MKTIIQYVFLFFLAFPVWSSETIAFWEFEGAQFLTDSVGPNHLKEHGAVEQLHNKIAFFPGKGCLSTSKQLTPKGDFSVEGYVSYHQRSIAKRNILFGEYLPDDRGWEAYIGSKNNLIVELAFDRKKGQYYVSDFIFEIGKSYYVGITIQKNDELKNEATVKFYFQELEEGTLLEQVVVKTAQRDYRHSEKGVFCIGGRSDAGIKFYGAMDDIRLSRGILAREELLISSSANQ